MALRVPKMLCHTDGTPVCEWVGDEYRLVFCDDDEPTTPFEPDRIWVPATVEIHISEQVVGSYDDTL